jgi:excisionase family DNA binding protein
MDATRKIEAERQRRALQRAMSIDQFCQRYEIGRTTAYAEIRHGRLRARKCGKRTIIADEDADDWLQQVPVIGGAR